MKKFLFRFMQLIFMFVLLFGGAALDSESMLIPVVLVIIGAAGLSVSIWVEEQYVEF